MQHLIASSLRRTGFAPFGIFGAVLALTLANLFAVLGAGTPWFLVLATPVYAAYVTAALLVAVGICNLLRDRPLRPVPLLSRRWSPRTSYRVLTLFVVAITVLREGACSDVRADYNVYLSESTARTRSSTSTSRPTTGERGAAPMASLPIACTASCDVRSGETCQAAIAGLCAPGVPPGDEWVHVSIEVSVDEPFCYVPLLKSDELRFHAAVSLDHRPMPGGSAIDLTVDGSVALKALGPMSCRSYRQRMAGAVRQEVLKAVGATLARN